MPERGSGFTDVDQSRLLDVLKERFEEHASRHPELEWGDVASRLEANPDKIRTLAAMDESGGEPDAVGRLEGESAILFVDCSKESPDGRRSLCYDPEALAARKKHKPRGSAVGMAEDFGARLLDPEQYRRLQSLGEFDTKTSSWLLTPPEIRERGGAIFGDFRYGTVFTYHNGAESYYAARGFRCWVAV